MKNTSDYSKQPREVSLRDLKNSDIEAEGGQQEGCGGALRLLFCNCTPRDNFRSMF